MSKGSRMMLGTISRRMFFGSFFVLGLTAAAGAFSFGFNGSLSQSFADAANSQNAVGGLRDFSAALVWAQVAAITALTLLSAMLFALAWFLRERLIAPLDALRRSLISATGPEAQPVSGLERKDEIGAVARAADRLRQMATAYRQHQGPQILAQAIERLIKDAGRLEADLARLASATSRASEKIEEASARAVKASHTAIEAAGLTRDGAQRMATQAENRIDALIETAKRLSTAMAQHADEGAPSDDQSEAGRRVATDEDAASALEGLVGDLDALERFARKRDTIESEQAVVLNAALIEAIDRLNAVAERIAATADQSAKDAAE
jgi:HAMP domain-containing protein